MRVQAFTDQQKRLLHTYGNRNIQSLTKLSSHCIISTPKNCSRIRQTTEQSLSAWATFYTARNDCANPKETLSVHYVLDDASVTHYCVLVPTVQTSTVDLATTHLYKYHTTYTDSNVKRRQYGGAVDDKSNYEKPSNVRTFTDNGIQAYCDTVRNQQHTHARRGDIHSISDLNVVLAKLLWTKKITLLRSSLFNFRQLHNSYRMKELLNSLVQ